MKIWIDADACPQGVKAAVFKAAMRLQIPVTMVANSHMSYPHSSLIDFVLVEAGPDVADKYIADHLNAGDLVITADIPLASIIVERNAVGINPRGEIYTEENVCEHLSMRDFMKDLRDSGLVQGGPPPFSPKDVQNFTNALERTLTKMRKTSK
mgnify:FL=1